MDYTEILAIAKEKLGKEYQYIIDGINLRISSGSTGGEIGSLVGFYLKTLRDQNHHAYLLLKGEIDLYLSQFTFIK